MSTGLTYLAWFQEQCCKPRVRPVDLQAAVAVVMDLSKSSMMLNQQSLYLPRTPVSGLLTLFPVVLCCRSRLRRDVEQPHPVVHRTPTPAEAWPRRCNFQKISQQEAGFQEESRARFYRRPSAQEVTKGMDGFSSSSSSRNVTGPFS